MPLFDVVEQGKHEFLGYFVLCEYAARNPGAMGVIIAAHDGLPHRAYWYTSGGNPMRHTTYWWDCADAADVLAERLRVAIIEDATTADLAAVGEALRRRCDEQWWGGN